MQYYSHSSLRTFASCPRKYWYTYIAGRIPARDDDKLVFGRAFHELAELCWTDGKDAAVAAAASYADGFEPDEYAKLLALLIHYNPPLDAYESLGVEVEFVLPVRHPDAKQSMRNVRYRGFTDGILRSENGAIVVREMKTTSEDILGFGPFWARLAIDEQISLYQIAHGADEVVYDVVKKPRQRLKKTETPEEFLSRLCSMIEAEPEVWYQWRTIPRTADDLIAAQASLAERVKILQFAKRRGLWPMQPGSCRSMFGVCPFLDVCAGRAALNDPERFVDREVV